MRIRRCRPAVAAMAFGSATVFARKVAEPGPHAFVRNSSTILESDRAQDEKLQSGESVIRSKPMIGSNSPPACAPPLRLDGDNHRCRR